MSPASSLQVRLETAGTPGVRPIDAANGVWSIAYPTFSLLRPSARAAVDRLKRDLIHSISESGRAIIYHPDSPAEEGLDASWTRAAGGDGWQVPQTIDLCAPSVEHWLFGLGNWTILSNEPTVPLAIDPFRASPSAMTEWLTSANVDAVLCSWPDDTEWLVAYRAPRRAS